MLVVENLQYQSGPTVILSTVSFRISEGDFVVIVGPNGSGKSTLIRCLSGWYQPSAGRVSFNNSSVPQMSSSLRAESLSFLPQRPHMSESIPIIDVVGAARFRFKESHRERRDSAMKLLRSLGLEHLSSRTYDSLSGGEAQRIAVACLKAQDAKLWLLDEPANHLDPAIQKQMYFDLGQEWQEGRTIVTVTHNINLILEAMPQCEHKRIQVIGLQEGKILFDIPLSDDTLERKFSELYGLPAQKVAAFGYEHLIFGRP